MKSKRVEMDKTYITIPELVNRLWHENCLILGITMSGKTTLLKKLKKNSLERQVPVTCHDFDHFYYNKDWLHSVRDGDGENTVVITAQSDKKVRDFLKFFRIKIYLGSSTKPGELFDIAIRKYIPQTINRIKTLEQFHGVVVIENALQRDKGLYSLVLDDKPQS